MNRIAIAIAFALATISPALAGTTGGLVGHITGENGKPLSGVHVTVISPTTERQSASDAKGDFYFLQLPPDQYTLQLDGAGLRSTIYQGIAVFADLNQVLTFRTNGLLSTTTLSGVSGNLDSSTWMRTPDAWSETDICVAAFSGFPNPVGAALLTIPGISIGAGGVTAH